MLNTSLKPTFTMYVRVNGCIYMVFTHASLDLVLTERCCEIQEVEVLGLYQHGLHTSIKETLLSSSSPSCNFDPVHLQVLED